MKVLSRVFTPTKNRRLNELIGLLILVSAVLLFLALASYSPLDPSLNTAGSRSVRNWVGLFGAITSDVLLQLWGITVFFVPPSLGLLGARWFRSREVLSPGAKTLGAVLLMVFLPALLALLPGHLLWRHAAAIEGLLGRIAGDMLLRWFNLIGATIVCVTVIAVAVYLSTAFSFEKARVWFETRFAFALALWQRFQDWRANRAARKEKALLDRRSGADRRLVPAQLFPAQASAQTNTGVEAMMLITKDEPHGSVEDSDALDEPAAGVAP